MRNIHENSPEHIVPGSSRSAGEKFLPKFFRCDHKQLYALNHCPVAGADRHEAVLICNATGHEYQSCHRAMRQLAVQLAKSGRHVVRFDYFGTGDSSGEYTQATLAQWRQDVADAIDECRRFSGLDRVSIVGIRLGATLAAQVASGRDDVENLVLYAPVLSGDTILAEWAHENAEYNRKLNLPHCKEISNEVIGYPLTDVFRAELISGVMLDKPSLSLQRALIFAENVEGNGMRQTSELLGSRGARITMESGDVPAIWRQEPMEAIVPFKLLRYIVAWLNEGKR